MSSIWILIISSLAISNLTLISSLCWGKSKGKPANFWMGSFLFSPALAMLNNATIFSGYGSFVLYHLALAANLVWGAYLIEFIRSLHHPDETMVRFRWYLYIPLYLYIPFIVFSMVHPECISRIFSLARIGKMTLTGTFYNFIITAYSIGASTTLLWKEYRNGDASCETSKYIREMLGMMLILLLIAFVPFMLEMNILYIILYMPVFGQIYFLFIFFRFNQTYKFIDHKLDPTQKTTEKYSTLSLNEEKTEEIKHSFLEYMDKEKPYLKPDYSMTDMAKDLHILPNQLSMVVNSKLNCSFPDYINAQRVKTALELLHTAHLHNLTIEAIAYESGFNNRTTFYKVFKKNTGKLPSDYLKKQTRTHKAGE